MYNFIVQTKLTQNTKRGVYMRAKIGDKYEIVSDSACYTLYKLGVAGAGTKNAGEVTRSVVGYYGDIDSLIKMFPNRVLLNSGADNLKDAIAEVRALCDDLKAAMVG